MGRKWANIVAKKTAKDGATSKIYAKFGVEIYAAAKQGEPDPELNTSLKFVIERAKQAQVPKHVIDKAIDKAKGGGDETFVQGRYEGFGPNGSMIIAETLTSNVNRTIANVRTIFNKKGGNIGAAGLAQLLIGKGINVSVTSNGCDIDTKEQTVIEAGSGLSHFGRINTAFARIDLKLPMQEFSIILDNMQEYNNKNQRQDSVYVLISANKHGKLKLSAERLMSKQQNKIWIVPCVVSGNGSLYLEKLD